MKKKIYRMFLQLRLTAELRPQAVGPGGISRHGQVVKHADQNS